MIRAPLRLTAAAIALEIERPGQVVRDNNIRME